MAAARTWNIVLHHHADASFTARVWVDGKLLRPDCVACSAAAALDYVEEALSDARPGDQLAVRAQGSRGIETASHAEPGAVRRWLEPRARSLMGAEAPSEGAKSGTRPIVGPEQAEASSRGRAAKA